MKFLRRAFATIAAIAFAGGAAAADHAVAANDRVAAANDHVAAANDHVAMMVVADSTVPYALPAQPSMYSFADIYRLTVAGASSPRLPKSAASADYQLRVVSSEPQPPVRQLFPAASVAPVQASYLFSIGAMPQPERWLLFLSGLAAAAWVARRRLGNSF
jgi:hypothetical protein